jgi:hypothetical protein
VIPRRAPAALVAAALGLALTGCGSGSSEPTAQTTVSAPQQRQQLREAKQGFLRNVQVEAPSLAHARAVTLMRFGQNVCHDLGAGDWPRNPMMTYSRRYGMNLQQITAVVHGAVGFLCPEYRHLVEPGS